MEHGARKHVGTPHAMVARVRYVPSETFGFLIRLSGRVRDRALLFVCHCDGMGLSAVWYNALARRER